MPSRIVAGLIVATALLAPQGLAPSALAQTEPAGQPSLAIPPPTPENRVRVSLGDEVVRSGLATALSVRNYELPMTVTVSPEVAAGACPVNRASLDQQLSVSPSRTCTAKELTPELVQSVREVVAAK